MCTICKQDYLKPYYLVVHSVDQVTHISTTNGRIQSNPATKKKMIKELEIEEEKIIKTYLVHPSYIRERFSIDVDSLIK